MTQTVMPPVNPPSMPPQAAAKTSGLATASMVLGILSFLTVGLTSLPAVIMGHIARSNIKNSGGALKGGGQATTGLVTGYIGLLIVPMAAVAGLAAPMILRQRDAADRTLLTSNMKQMYFMMVEFDDEYGTFPCDDLAEKVEASTGVNQPMTGPDVLMQLEAAGNSDLMTLLEVPARLDGDWLYFPARTLSDPATEPLLISPAIREKRVVLTVDGAVMPMPEISSDFARWDADPGGVTIPAPRRK